MSTSLAARRRAAWAKYEQLMEEKRAREADARFLCVDCRKDTKGSEYYRVEDEVWAASGLAPNGGMLCLACLEGRIGRPLTWEEFTALRPSASAWERHVAARDGNVTGG
jgi:hypothetical protein